MNRYAYEELAAKALAPEATPEDINALGEWFAEYGAEYWNGEYYDADDGMRLFPLYQENEDGDTVIFGWELR